MLTGICVKTKSSDSTEAAEYSGRIICKEEKVACVPVEYNRGVTSSVTQLQQLGIKKLGIKKNSRVGEEGQQDGERDVSTV